MIKSRNISDLLDRCNRAKDLTKPYSRALVLYQSISSTRVRLMSHMEVDHLRDEGVHDHAVHSFSYFPRSDVAIEYPK